MSTTESQALAIVTDEQRQIAHSALDRLLDSGIGGSTHDPNVAAAFMEIAQRKHILLTPVMGAFRMRPGWELAFTKLRVDTSREAGMVYKVSRSWDDDEDSPGARGREWGPETMLGFHKTLLYQIRTHLGIDAEDAERVDDRSKDYCYEFKMKGTYLGVDGRLHTLVAHGGLDLSEGSEAAQKILDEARGRSEQEKRANGERALRLKRAKVMQNADTNTQERLIVSYGFRGSYRKRDLDEKYIVCVKPIYTGYDPDPAVRAKLLDDMLRRESTSMQMLYSVGGSDAPVSNRTIGTGPQRAERARELSPAEQMFGEAGQEPEKPKAWIVPFGKHKDKPITELSDDALSGLLDANVDMCEMIKDKPMMKADYEAHTGYQKEIEAEVARRQKGEEKY